MPGPSLKTEWARNVAADAELPYASRLLAVIAVTRFADAATGELHLSWGQAARAVGCKRGNAGRVIAPLVDRGWLVPVAKGTHADAARYRTGTPDGWVLIGKGPQQ